MSIKIKDEKPRTTHNLTKSGGRIIKDTHAKPRRFNFGPGGSMNAALAASKAGK